MGTVLHSLIQRLRQLSKSKLLLVGLHSALLFVVPDPLRNGLPKELRWLRLQRTRNGRCSRRLLRLLHFLLAHRRKIDILCEGF